MDAMTEDVIEMTDQQLAQTVAEGTAEMERRARIREAEQTTDDMALSYLQAAGRAQGEPWEPPIGFIGSYPRGWRVHHAGRAYEATAPGVTTSPLPPDTDCWVEVDPDTEPIPFWDPGTYAKDTLVRDAGRVWRALADGTDGPRPSEYPGGWVIVD